MSSAGSITIQDLPTAILTDIFSRLPTKTIISCKSVCKFWLHILIQPYFANLHLSRSHTSLLIHQMGTRLPASDSDIIKLVEIEDESDRHGLRYDPVMKFDLRVCCPTTKIHLVGSVNGLFCFRDYQNESLFICNPTVRQYLAVPQSKQGKGYPLKFIYGFGFSSISGQYKLVQIYQKALSDPASGKRWRESTAEVYTLGSGKWRSIGIVPFLFRWQLYTVTLNGNIHWLISDPESFYSICAFDIEKEAFQGFPSVPQRTRGSIGVSLGLLEGRLCVCHDSPDSSDLVIWVMQEYGVLESWKKEIVISKNLDRKLLSCAVVTPIKVWRNGDIWMLLHGAVLLSYNREVLLSYNRERNSLQEEAVLRDSAQIVDRSIAYEMMLHVVSFCSLKDFVTEKVDMF